MKVFERSAGGGRSVFRYTATPPALPRLESARKIVYPLTETSLSDTSDVSQVSVRAKREGCSSWERLRISESLLKRLSSLNNSTVRFVSYIFLFFKDKQTSFQSFGFAQSCKQNE